MARGFLAALLMLKNAPWIAEVGGGKTKVSTVNHSMGGKRRKLDGSDDDSDSDWAPGTNGSLGTRRKLQDSDD